MISLIIGLILLAFGAFCLINPDNFLLPYTNFYYNPKKPLKPVMRKGGFGEKHIKEFGKTKGMLLYMRVLGAVVAAFGILCILSYFKIV